MGAKLRQGFDSQSLIAIFPVIFGRPTGDSFSAMLGGAYISNANPKLGKPAPLCESWNHRRSSGPYFLSADPGPRLRSGDILHKLQNVNSAERSS